MNKRTRLVVSMLFAVLIILAAAITRFYVVFPEKNDPRDKQPEIAALLETDDNGCSVFRSESGEVGILRSGRVTAAPEWKELTFAGDGRCIAGKKLGGRVLYGCIDYEGNVTVPLVYQSIAKHKVGGQELYIAESPDRMAVVVYDGDFQPCFRNGWKSCTVGESEITLTDDLGSYVYTVTSGGMLFKSANISGSMLDCDYDISVYSRVLLSKLSVPMIGRMMSDTERYFEFAFSGDDTLLPETSGGRSGFVPLFAGDEKILSRRLTRLSNVYIYSVSSRDGAPVFETAATADIEITYIGADGKTERLTQQSKAAVRFRGSSEADLTAVSGAFSKEKPDYPDPEDSEQSIESA